MRRCWYCGRLGKTPIFRGIFCGCFGRCVKGAEKAAAPACRGVIVLVDGATAGSWMETGEPGVAQGCRSLSSRAARISRPSGLTQVVVARPVVCRSILTKLAINPCIGSLHTRMVHVPWIRSRRSHLTGLIGMQSFERIDATPIRSPPHDRSCRSRGTVPRWSPRPRLALHPRTIFRAVDHDCAAGGPCRSGGVCREATVGRLCRLH